MPTKRLLCCMSSMDAGGAETFLMKQLRQLDREKYAMDFCVNVEEPAHYDSEILSSGSRLFRIPPKSQSFAASLKALEDLVRREKYENVLVNSVKPGTSLELIAAKRGGARRLIYRSSNTSVTTKKQEILHSTVGLLARFVPNVMLAPSEEAAAYCFGKRNVEKGKVHILHNGIDPEVYRFSQSDRQKIRDEFGLGNSFVILNVGRLTPEKNQIFLVKCLKKLIKLRPDARLLITGTGETAEDIKEYAIAEGIRSRIIFTGVRRDVPALMSAADVFMLPSFYEGMPNTVIESQALSLPCLISDRVTKSAAITDIAEFLPIDDPDLWAEKALGYQNSPRGDMTEKIKSAGYDIESVHKEFIYYCFGDKS